MVVVAVSVLFFASLMIYPLLGTELFPETDAGTFTINFRAPAGTRDSLSPKEIADLVAYIRLLTK
jgi:multidrug efflux pump subunit AcrB